MTANDKRDSDQVRPDRLLDRDVEDSSQLMTLRDVARRWKTSERTVQRIVATGTLPYIRVGRQLRFRLEDVEDWERRHRIGPFGQALLKVTS